MALERQEVFLGGGGWVAAVPCFRIFPKLKNYGADSKGLGDRRGQRREDEFLAIAKLFVWGTETIAPSKTLGAPRPPNLAVLRLWPPAQSRTKIWQQTAQFLTPEKRSRTLPGPHTGFVLTGSLVSAGPPEVFRCSIMSFRSCAMRFSWASTFSASL